MAGQNKVKVLCLLLASVSLLGVLASCSQPPQPILQPAEWNFGTIAADSPIERSIGVTNPGRNSLEVRFLSTCACLLIEPDSMLLRGREQASVRLRYDPAEDEGPIAMQVIVRSGKAKLTSRQVLRVEGNVLPGTANAPSEARPAPTASEHALQLAFDYYYDPGCKGCEIFLVRTMIALQLELGIRLRVARHDISKPDSEESYLRRLKELGFEEKGYPAVIFADVVLQGDEQIEREFKGALQKHLADLAGRRGP